MTALGFTNIVNRKSFETHSGTRHHNDSVWIRNMDCELLSQAARFLGNKFLHESDHDLIYFKLNNESMRKDDIKCVRFPKEAELKNFLEEFNK